MKNQEFIKKWYKGGITPAYQLSDLSEIEKKEMDRDLNKIRFEYKNMEQEISKQTETKALSIADVTPRFSKEDLWDAWWASAIKTISFSGVDKDYERRCFEKFYENKLSSLNGG